MKTLVSIMLVLVSCTAFAKGGYNRYSEYDPPQYEEVKGSYKEYYGKCRTDKLFVENLEFCTQLTASLDKEAQ